MKKLTLVRHSLACKSSEAINDRARYLTNEGIALIKELSIKVNRSFIEDSLFIASNAIRAYQTAIEFIVTLNAYDKVSFKIEPFVYELVNFNELVSNILVKFESYSNMWIFGHNPSLSNISSTLLGKKIFMNKCSIVHFEFNVNKWNDISPSNLINYFFIDSKID
ncbi:MAG: histidine phosphatase family protein [Bacteroidales bacterium]|nr:histidine phosphatase family protein [Bacteroidales bacterium]